MMMMMMTTTTMPVIYYTILEVTYLQLLITHEVRLCFRKIVWMSAIVDFPGPVSVAVEQFDSVCRTFLLYNQNKCHITMTPLFRLHHSNS